MLGTMVVARCTSELDPLMRKAGGLWEPGAGTGDPSGTDGAADPQSAPRHRSAVPAGRHRSGRRLTGTARLAARGRPRQSVDYAVATPAPICYAPANGRAQSAGEGERVMTHPELSMVSLTRPVEADGRLLPSGSTGTVVHVYPDERAYEVEFNRPFHAVATVDADAIAE